MGPLPLSSTSVLLGMEGRVRKGSILVAAVSATMLLASAGIASAHDESGRSEAHGKTVLASFDWHVSRDSDGAAHGYFRSKSTSPFDPLIHLQGPATCVDIEGNRVGFLYPIEDSSRPFLIKGQYVLITGEDNGGHGRDKMGFLGPAPKEFFPGCAPGVAPLSVDGHIAVHDDHG